MEYNKYIKIAKQYNIKYKTKNNKSITFNKLQKRVEDYLSKIKNNNEIHNIVMLYLNDQISHEDLIKKLFLI
jgi:hypothetical protein